MKKIYIDNEPWPYYVTTEGVVINQYGKKLKPWARGSHQGDYLTVGLCKPGEKRRRVMIHRLVAEAFLDRLPGQKEVNHKDLDRHNNKVDNLEWVTHSENIQHRNKERRKEREQGEINIFYDIRT